MPDQEREEALAELLREVRSLRQDLEQLKGLAGVRLNDPSYAVLAVSDSARDPEYAVLVRQLGSLGESERPRAGLREPSYEVLVRQDLRDLEDPVIEEQ